MLKELRNKLTETVKAAKDILAKAEGEKRDLTADERSSYDTALVNAETIRGDIERRSRLDAIDAALQAPANSRVAPTDATNSLGVPDKDFRRYSLLRAIDMRSEGKELDGLEGELSKEIARRSGKSAQGFFVPMEIQLADRRDLTTSTGVGGLASSVLFSDFITLLRKKLVIQQLGARYMGGLVGTLSIPRQSGGATAAWVTEGNAPTQTNQTIDSVPLAPKTVAANTVLSRKFVKQTSLDAEAFVRDDLATVLALEIDRAAIYGSGTGAEPTGILSLTGISTVTSGGTPTFANTAVALESALATKDADLGTLAYLTNAKVRGTLKTTVENAGAGANYIWRGDNTVNGYRALATNNVPSTMTAGGAFTGGALNAMIFGNWADLIVAQWGGLDVIVDPYSLGSSGGLKISVLQDTDIQVRHKESFAKCVDIA